MVAPTAGSPNTTKPFTNDYRTDSLLEGPLWGTGTGTTVITYSFPFSDDSSYWSTSSATGYGPSNGSEAPWDSDFAPLNTQQQDAARAALAVWSNVANITFQEVSETTANVGTLRFAFTGYEMTGAAAYAYLPDSSARAGDIWISSTSLTDTSWAPGSFNFQTLVHEIGHTLGLKHPFEASGSGIALAAADDYYGNSVMSYSPTAGNQDASISFETTTPMLYDILAIQYLYGANTAYNNGSSTYTYGQGGNYYETIWDTGGTDTIVFTGSSSVAIDLQAGAWSQLGAPLVISTESGNLTQRETVRIADGVVIENATGGSGNDTITGNSSNNILTGGGGSDSILGGDGGDYIDVSAGFGNVVNGGNQGDTIVGSATGDELRGGKGLDSIDGGGGNDTMYSGLGSDTLTGGSGDDIFVVRGFDAVFQGALLAPTITDFVRGSDRIAIQGVEAEDIAAILATLQVGTGGVTLTVDGPRDALITVLGVNTLDASDVYASGTLGV
ncbi:MAG: M10 family metallopeptidase C-terminal domain-containing protein [Alphaproteobacteria bacterium]|nr:M10 family metallopeptidase C-terminal domain-containing protein [Alphaproteobacteria bacterium]